MRRIKVTEQISDNLESSFIGKHIYKVEVHEIKVDENDVSITMDFALDGKWAVVVNLQVGLSDDTLLSCLLREQLEKKRSEKHWFELDPHGSQEYNVRQLNRYLAAFGVRLTQGSEIGAAGAAALQLCVEQISGKEEEAR